MRSSFIGLMAFSDAIVAVSALVGLVCRSDWSMSELEGLFLSAEILDHTTFLLGTKKMHKKVSPQRLSFCPEVS